MIKHALMIAATMAALLVAPAGSSTSQEREVGHYKVVNGVMDVQSGTLVDAVCGADGVKLYAGWSVSDTRTMTETIRRAVFAMNVYEEGVNLGSSSFTDSWTSTPHTATSGPLNTPTVILPAMPGLHVITVVLTGSLFEGLSTTPSWLDAIEVTIAFDCSGVLMECAGNMSKADGNGTLTMYWADDTTTDYDILGDAVVACGRGDVSGSYSSDDTFSVQELGDDAVQCLWTFGTVPYEYDSGWVDTEDMTAVGFGCGTFDSTATTNPPLIFSGKLNFPELSP